MFKAGLLVGTILMLYFQLFLSIIFLFFMQLMKIDFIVDIISFAISTILFLAHIKTTVEMLYNMEKIEFYALEKIKEKSLNTIKDEILLGIKWRFKQEIKNYGKVFNFDFKLEKID